MKLINNTLGSVGSIARPTSRSKKFKPTLALASAVALAMLGASIPIARAQTAEDQNANTQVAEILQLLADFHGALSYGGNITAMMSLWTEDSSITLNGVTHFGKDAERAFFLSGGYFKNTWVSLAPEYKTQITVHGNTAEATTQCVAIDLTVTPMVVRSVIQVNASIVKRDGKWLFLSTNNTTPAPL